MSRILAIALLACACGSSKPGPNEAAPEAEVADSRGGIRPYDPARAKALDFSGVDVGDEALQDAPTSERELGEALMAALAAKDDETLQALALSKAEYERLYPVLIRHPNALKMGATMAWENLQRESQGDRATALSRYGGTTHEFVELRPQETLERPKVRVLVRPVVIARDESGAEHELVMLGSVVEHRPSSTWKIVAFRDTR
jgi:hypothetical protein